MFRTPEDKGRRGAVPKQPNHNYNTRSSRRNISSEFGMTEEEEGAVGGHPDNTTLTHLRDISLDLPPPARQVTPSNGSLFPPGFDARPKRRSEAPERQQSLPTLPTLYGSANESSQPNQQERPHSSMGFRNASAEHNGSNQQRRSSDRSFQDAKPEFREAPDRRLQYRYQRTAQPPRIGNVWPAHPGRELRPEPPVPPNTPQRAVRQVSRHIPRNRPWGERDSRSTSPLRKPAITSWNICFTGDSQSLTAQEFLFRIEIMKRNQRLADRDLLNNIALLLKHKAEDWYWDVFCRKFTNPSWNTFKEQLIDYFEPQTSDWDLMRKLCTLRQGSDSVEEFLTKINKLHNRMIRPLSEYELYQLAEEGLNVKMYNLIKPYRLRSVEELRRVGKEIERKWQQYSRDLTNRYGRPGVAEIEAGLESEFSQLTLMSSASPGPIEELSRRPTYTKQALCWNCDQTGHLFNDCPEETRRLFCFRCGKLGVTTPKCPVCSVTGNGRRSGNPRPDLRSLPNPNQVASTPRNSLPK